MFAVFFGALLFAEWGSHGVILSANVDGQGGEMVSANERGHDDPCKTLICTDGQRKDQGTRFSHDSSQHNALFHPPARAYRQLARGIISRPHSSSVSGIFRPPDPAFHPPEVS